MNAMREMDDQPYFTTIEIQRATGIDRKKVSSIGRRLGLGDTKYLEEGVQSVRMYYSVDDVMKIGKYRESMRKVIRKNLWTKSRTTPITETIQLWEETPFDNKDIHYRKEKLDMVSRSEDEYYDSDRLEQLRQTLGSIAYTNTKTRKGILNTQELDSMFQLDGMMISRLEDDYGLERYSDGVDRLYYFSDVMRSVIHMIDDVDSEGEELLPPIPIEERTILQDINKVGSFFHDKDYRMKVIERVRKPKKTHTPIWKLTENRQYVRK